MNWNSVWDEAKRHPYLVGGSILALVVLIWWFWSSGSSSSSGSAGVYAYSADPNLVAQQTQEALSQNQTNAAVTVAGLQSQDTLAAIQAQTAQATTAYSSAVQVNAQNTTAAVQVATLQAGALTNQYNTELAAVQSTNATALAISTAQTNAILTSNLSAQNIDWTNQNNALNAASWATIEGNSAVASTLASVYHPVPTL